MIGNIAWVFGDRGWFVGHSNKTLTPGVALVRHKPMAFGRVTLTGSAVPASRDRGRNRNRGRSRNRDSKEITQPASRAHLDSDRDIDSDPDSDPDELSHSPRFAGQAKATASSRGRLPV